MKTTANTIFAHLTENNTVEGMLGCMDDLAYSRAQQACNEGDMDWLNDLAYNADTCVRENIICAYADFHGQAKAEKVFNCTIRM